MNFIRTEPTCYGDDRVLRHNYPINLDTVISYRGNSFHATKSGIQVFTIEFTTLADKLFWYFADQRTRDIVMYKLSHAVNAKFIDGAITKELWDVEHTKQRAVAQASEPL